MKFDELKVEGYERVVLAKDDDGFDAVIAIHNTNLGLALGGCRVMGYDSHEAHLNDALSLSKGMTYKSSLAGLNLGGGKSVINCKKNTPQTMEKFAKFLDYVNKDGEVYRSGGDIGTSAEDIGYLSTLTPHINHMNAKEDSGYATAYGVYMAMLGAMAFTGRDFRKQIVGINGLGKVGNRLAGFIKNEAFGVFGNDIALHNEVHALKQHNVPSVTRDELLQRSTIYSPCAAGQELDLETLKKLSPGDIVCGGANNVFPSEALAVAYAGAGITVVPDYLANAGGVIIIQADLSDGSYTDPDINKKLQNIMFVTEEVLTRARDEGYPPSVIADKMAEERFMK